MSQQKGRRAHEKGTSGVDRKDAGLRFLQGGQSPWDPGPNICLQPHKEVFPHSLESLLSALRDGKGHLALGKPTGFVFCSQHKTQSVGSLAQVPRLGQSALHAVG